ncbi:MAG: hypothetical protein HY903_24180 [Deltaproteobacteria bacterium]|nr:hypothetical protein [Deltaproteobacteria bacterium]
MAEGRPELNLRHVILPWAPPEPEPIGPDPQAGARLSAEAAKLKVSPDRLTIERKHERSKPAGAQSRAALPAASTPPLFAAATLFKPHPSIPDEDRAHLDPEALLSAAVALDVLATRTRPIRPDSDVLLHFAEALLAVGQLGGIDDAAKTRLLEHAASRSGQLRGLLSREVAARMQAAPRPVSEVTAVTAATAITPSTPRTVAHAVHRIEKAAARVVAEARLRLEARERVLQYRQG